MPSKPPGKVPNKYKAAVDNNYRQASAAARELAKAMSEATSAMNNKAWVSTRADAFAGELKSADSTLKAAGGGCEAALKAKRDSEPDMVDADSWQAKWIV
jgi:thioredoxin reductase